MTAEIHIVCSDDPLLRSERAAYYLSKGRKALPDAQFLLYTTQDLQSASPETMNFKHLEGEMSSPGLLIETGNRLIKINLDGVDGTTVTALNVIAENLREGICVVVEMPRITSEEMNVKAAAAQRRCLNFENQQASGGKGAKQTKSRRGRSAVKSQFKEALSHVKGAGGSVEVIYPPEGAELITWINRRAESFGLRLTPQAAEFTARSADNNLMLISQMLQIMSFTHAERTVDEIAVSEYLSNDARYKGFELAGAVCEKDALKALSIISSACTAAGSGKAAGLRLMIGVMNDCLSLLLEAKDAKLTDRAVAAVRSARNGFVFLKSGELFEFMRNRGVNVPQIRSAYVHAIAEMPYVQLQTMALSLSEAARLYSDCRFDEAYLALQRTVMLCRTSEAMHLSSETEGPLCRNL